MAQKDWKVCYKDEAGTTYRMTKGDREVDLIAYGHWFNWCALQFYKREKRTGTFSRVTVDGRDFWDDDNWREDTMEFPNCRRAEKFALAWLNQ